MISTWLTAKDGLGAFQTVSLVLFVVVFVMLTYRAITMGPEKAGHFSRLPLADDSGEE